MGYILHKIAHILFPDIKIQGDEDKVPPSISLCVISIGAGAVRERV